MFSCTSRVLAVAVVLSLVAAVRGGGTAPVDSGTVGGVLRECDQTAADDALPEVSWRRRRGQRWPLPDQPRGDSRGGRLGPGGFAGSAGRKPAARGGELLQLRNAAQRQTAGRADRGTDEVGRPGASLGTPGDELAERSSDKHGPPAVNEDAKAFWSFQPVVPPAPPATHDNSWVRTPIDAFVLARLEQAGLEPAPPAEKTALLRRAYYDLIGLPPSPAEVEAFLADDAPGAFERVVDTLLESPHYGERWGRHWLDLVRYAETNSYERDGAKPFVWRYRDYVIRSFNNDKPYDQFVTEQLAGDELEPLTPDSIIATGYYRLGLWQDEPVDPEQELFEDLDDLVRTTGEVFLGLTVGCARCHDHKLDPMPQADYYRLLAFFRNVRRFGVRSQQTIDDASVCSLATPEEVRQNQQQVADHKQQTKEVREELAALDERIVASAGGRRQGRLEDRGDARRDRAAANRQGALAGGIRPLCRVGGAPRRAGEVSSGRTRAGTVRQGTWPRMSADPCSGARQCARSRSTGGAGFPVGPFAAGAGHLAAGRRRAIDWSPASPGPLDYAARESAHRPGDGQSHLALSLRPRARAFDERLRLPGDRSDASGTARLAGLGIRGRRLAAQAAAQADHAVEHVSDVVRGK